VSPFLACDRGQRASRGNVDLDVRSDSAIPFFSLPHLLITIVLARCSLVAERTQDDHDSMLAGSSRLPFLQPSFLIGGIAENLRRICWLGD